MFNKHSSRRAVCRYENIDGELRNRLAALEATRERAYNTDADAIVAPR
jgi:hypothetical protein